MEPLYEGLIQNALGTISKLGEPLWDQLGSYEQQVV